MKKQMLFLAVALCALLSGCKKEAAGPLVEGVVFPPATESFTSGAPLTIQGTGFVATDQIILRISAPKAEGDIVVAITEVTPTGITFTLPPETPAGNYSVILLRGGVELVLGNVVITRPILVKEIKQRWTSGTRTEAYQYDLLNRVTTYSFKYYNSESMPVDSFDAQLSYEPNLIHAKVEYKGKTHQLSVPLDKDGRALELDLSSFGDSKMSMTYHTEGGIKQLEDQYQVNSDIYLTDFVWANGNMVKQSVGEGVWEYEYSDIPNKTNFDAVELIGNRILRYTTGINLGITSKSLISKCTRTHNGLSEYVSVSEYVYDYNAAGYPVKVTEKEVGSTGEMTIEITYTK